MIRGNRLIMAAALFGVALGFAAFQIGSRPGSAVAFPSRISDAFPDRFEVLIDGKPRFTCDFSDRLGRSCSGGGIVIERHASNAQLVGIRARVAEISGLSWALLAEDGVEIEPAVNVLTGQVLEPKRRVTVRSSAG